jgi:PAS domain S-box-containing protein
MAEMTGYPVDEILGKTAFDLMFPEDRAKLGENLVEERRKSHRLLDLRLRRKDGSELWVLVTSNPIQDSAGNYSGTVSLLTDITERKAMEEDLRESEARSQAILNSALDAVVTIDHEGRIVEFNPAAEKMFGHRQAEVLGRKMGEVIVPAELRDRHQSMLERCAQTGEVHILGRLIELPAMRADGSVFPAEMTINRVEYGSRLLFTGFIRDITVRKQVEEALRISEERYRTLISASVSVVWTTNAAGEFDRPQPSWEKYTGQRWAEYNGFGWAQAIHEEDRERVKEVRQRASETKEACHTEGRIFCGATNSWRYFVGRGVPLLNEDGSVREWIGTVTDIEDQKRAEFEIRQLNASLEKRVAERTMELELTNKELESFCYSVSHDLRAPLRAIDGFSLALEEDYAPMLDAAGKNYLERVRKATKRMAVLIDDLLELSRITRAELKLQDVDLTQLMRVALDNLLGNAWKFTQHQPKPRIEFGVTIQGDQTVYFVRDNGAGFDMNYASKLFGVFQRLHSATEYEGTGVGLANVQRVIHRHGGHVWAEAKVNEGATFYFTLPKPEQTA